MYFFLSIANVYKKVIDQNDQSKIKRVNFSGRKLISTCKKVLKNNKKLANDWILCGNNEFVEKSMNDLQEKFEPFRPQALKIINALFEKKIII